MLQIQVHLYCLHAHRQNLVSVHMGKTMTSAKIKILAKQLFLINTFLNKAFSSKTSKWFKPFKSFMQTIQTLTVQELYML